MLPAIVYITLSMYRKILYCAVIALACFGCAPRVSYSVRTLYTDSRFSERDFRNAVTVLCPLLNAKGAVIAEGLEPENMAAVVQNLRPDLRFAPYSEFENGFPARFDRRELAKFYNAAFEEEILAVKGMDSVWQHIKHQYVLIFSLIDGASIRDTDSSVFKQVSVRGDLWRGDGREVVWRGQCKGVSDDIKADGGLLIIECMRLLTGELPLTESNYGREKW